MKFDQMLREAARLIVNDSDPIDAIVSLANLVAVMMTFLPIGQRYLVAEHLRTIADHAERAGELDEVAT